MLYSTGHPNRVAVREVISGSAGDSAGLLRGDVIVRYDDQLVLSPGELRDATTQGRAGELVELEVQREGESGAASHLRPARPDRHHARADGGAAGAGGVASGGRRLASRSGEIEEQHLGVVARGDREARFVARGQPVACAQPLPVHVERPARDLQPGMTARAEPVLDARARRRVGPRTATRPGAR